MMGQLRRSRLLLRQIRATPKLIKDCVSLIIIGHILTYASYFMHLVNRGWSLKKVDWFMSPFFSMKIERAWYLKFGGEHVLWVLTYYIAAKIALQFSDGLFIVCLIFFGYHVIDCFMFWWNYNTGFYMYVDLLWTCIILTKYAILPYKAEKWAKIKSLF